MGCSGCPSHVPLRRSFRGPAGTAALHRLPERLGSARRGALVLLHAGDRRVHRVPGVQRARDRLLAIGHGPGLPRIRRPDTSHHVGAHALTFPFRSGAPGPKETRCARSRSTRSRSWVRSTWSARRVASVPSPPTRMDQGTAPRRPHARDGRHDGRGADRAHDLRDHHRARRAHVDVRAAGHHRARRSVRAPRRRRGREPRRDPRRQPDRVRPHAQPLRADRG